MHLFLLIIIQYVNMRGSRICFGGGGWIQGIILFLRGEAYFREFYNVTFKNRNFQKRGVI